MLRNHRRRFGCEMLYFTADDSSRLLINFSGMKDRVAHTRFDDSRAAINIQRYFECYINFVSAF